MGLSNSQLPRPFTCPAYHLPRLNSRAVTSTTRPVCFNVGGESKTSESAACLPAFESHSPGVPVILSQSRAFSV